MEEFYFHVDNGHYLHEKEIQKKNAGVKFLKYTA